MARRRALVRIGRVFDRSWRGDHATTCSGSLQPAALPAFRRRHQGVPETVDLRLVLAIDEMETRLGEREPWTRSGPLNG